MLAILNWPPFQTSMLNIIYLLVKVTMCVFILILFIYYGSTPALSTLKTITHVITHMLMFNTARVVIKHTPMTEKVGLKSRHWAYKA